MHLGVRLHVACLGGQYRVGHRFDVASTCFGSPRPSYRSALLVVNNKHRRRFTALDWNSYNQELLLADEMGYVNVWNIYMDKCLKELRVARKPVRSVSISGKTQKFELTCGNTVQRWHIMRQLQFAMFTG